LLSFVGNEPVIFNQPSPIRVSVRTLGPYRPRGRVFLRAAGVPDCTVQLTPSPSNPFESVGSCNVVVPGGANLSVDAFYDSGSQAFFDVNAGVPTANRSIPVIIPPPDRMLCDGFESQSPFGACP
jgi:hypothetical protein